MKFHPETQQFPEVYASPYPPPYGVSPTTGIVKDMAALNEEKRKGLELFPPRPRNPRWVRVRRVRAHWWHYEVGPHGDPYEETGEAFPRNLFLMETYDPSALRRR